MINYSKQISEIREGLDAMKAWIWFGAMVLVASPLISAADLAKVNGRAVTDQDLRDALSSYNEGQRETLLKDKTTRRQVLINVIDQMLLMQQGEKEKLDQDKEYKQAADLFRRQYLANRVLQKNLSGKLTDASAQKYYELHKNRFSTDQARAQHILLADENQAKDVMKKAKEANADFEALAEKHSKDPSAKNNRGDVGMITRDSAFVKEFKDAVFNTEPGQIIGPVKTTFGYHVIKVIERKIGKPLSYSEVELKVKNEMQAELIQTYVGKLKGQAKISIDEKQLEKM